MVHNGATQPHHHPHHEVQDMAAKQQTRVVSVTVVVAEGVTDEQVAEAVAPLAVAKPATLGGGPTTHLLPGCVVNGAEAADLLVLAAYRRCGNDGAKMLKLLTEAATVFGPRHGGAIGERSDSCYPDVPGCNWYTAQWLKDLDVALQSACAKVRI